jgi:hypothetical protein
MLLNINLPLIRAKFLGKEICVIFLIVFVNEECSIAHTIPALQYAQYMGTGITIHLMDWNMTTSVIARFF